MGEDTAPPETSTQNATHTARKLLCQLPHNEPYELPGRPHVVYELRDYSSSGKCGAVRARQDIPFLFKPFEMGQPLPPPPEVDRTPRQSTIHEYLDWTVTAAAPGPGEDLDFSGFRVVVLFSRFRPNWPAPGAYDTEGEKADSKLGAAKKPIPMLLMDGKPVSAATVRCGQEFLEVPFFATREGRRGKGYGRCLLEAIEEIARACGAVRILLCSTDDPDTRGTWKRLGFSDSNEDDFKSWGIAATDLLHMTNTVQMHKAVEPRKVWKSIKIKHASFVQRTYYPGTVADCTPYCQQTGSPPKSLDALMNSTQSSNAPLHLGDSIMGVNT